MSERDRQLFSLGEPMQEDGRIPAENPERIRASAPPPYRRSADPILVHRQGNET